jgi:hypothetical protein
MNNRPADILIDHERRISTLEGITSETRDRLNSVDNRLNTHTQLIVGLYGLIIIVGVGIIAAILTR